MNDRYRDTVRLLLDITPHVFAGGGFALKGGTAINMFIRDMPRLSVDLDLVHVDAASDRDQALGDIRRRLDEIRAALTKRGFNAPPARPVGDESRLLVSRSGLTVKVEVNTVFRGTVLPPVRMDLCAAAETLFSRTLTVPALAVEEVYAGKLVAAMDRQHPRDLFDVMKLREAGGITALTRQTFVACLCGHNRPINELLTPNRIDIARAFENDFVGMTFEGVTLDRLQATRDWLFSTLPASLSHDERRFLASLKAGRPDWALMPFPHLQTLPAVRWKLRNIETLKAKNPKKHAAMLATLERKLSELPEPD
ncbi:MAG: nucleotidyl transferase AbiEii/AbiGii toxin family protein [Alphaproteobacteria bacterium]|nr:nucleotidyl transferase AbiEii/AbiGii toxin family protein [Alphaproteobacteria bacterium]